MFKAKTNKAQYIIKIIYLTFCISTFFLISGYSNLISMDSLLQKISQLSLKTNIESSSSNIWQKNLFINTLNNYNSSSNKSTLESIDNSLNIIMWNAQRNWIKSCNIKKSDIITILSNQPWFIEELSAKADIPLWTIIQSAGNIKSSCERFLRCENKLDISQELRQNKQLSDCKSIMYGIYNSNKELRENLLNLPLKNNNDNIYIDWNKDNGLFDIMIDITNIRNLLFEKNDWPKTPNMIYYSLPSLKNNNNSNIDNTIPWSISAFWSQIINNNIWQWTNEISWLLNWWNTTSSINNINTWNNNSLNTINAFINDIKSENNNSNIEKIPEANIQEALCPIPWSESEYNNTLPEQNSEEYNNQTIDELYLLQDQLINELSWFLYTPDSLSSLWWSLWWTNNGSSNIIKTDNALPSTTIECKNNCADKTWTEQLICEGKCCLNSCNQINNIKDKTICISQCLCWEASTANDMLRIKICRVPAQPARVLAWKKINSIEEAINEINEIFNKLKQNWLLSKRSKTQEFMDSSFSDIKFHEVFAFDIFVAVKPIYDKIQIRQKTEKIKKDWDTIKTINPFIWGNKIWGIWKDKNKYLIIWDTKSWDDWIKYCTTLGLEFDSANKKCRDNNFNESIIENLSKMNTSSILHDNIYTFTKEHYILREQIYKQFSDIQTIADILKTKSENAE